MAGNTYRPSSGWETANCMTCGWLMGIPKAQQFRCSICQTVNDLAPLRDRDHSSSVRPISLAHTEQLIHDCLRTYLIRSLGEYPTPGFNEGPASKSGDDDSTDIFKPVHDYLVACFRMFENVSSSFPAQPAFRENDLSGLPVGDPSPHQKSLQKSPQIYWDNVSKWYSVILNAADTWPVVLAEISQRSDSEYASPSEETLQRIGKDLLAAQTRLRKALMKVMESLLKRPGQITEPEELRFFLILLENPLLHSDTSHTVPSDKRYTLSAGSASAAADPSGRCSRILKRIIGLISNLPAELQNQLATWWSQYQAEQFAKTKDLIFGFLIYRTKRHEKHIRDGNDSDGKFNSTQNDEITHRTSRKQAKTKALKTYDCSYADDWQIKAASRVLSMLFDANNPYSPNRMDEPSWSAEPGLWRPSAAKGLFLPMSEFYNLLIDNIDVIDDFTGWETKSRRFSFCQYPFLLTIGAKMRILENYLYREMEHHRGGSFFHNVSNSRNTTHRGSFLLNVRRECLVEDTFKALDENLNSMRDQTKMPLMVRFQGEEGIDGGGLRNELFLLLGRDMFNPDRGLFISDEDSKYCYFSPYFMGDNKQYFLAGAALGLAVYNSINVDVPFPPFMFRKLLSAAPSESSANSFTYVRQPMRYGLNDLAQYRPQLAHGLRKLLEHDGDDVETFCLYFAIDVEKYDTTVQVELCNGGESRPVTNKNRREYVDLYVHHLLDTAVARQFELFQRGFYKFCEGNAFRLFRPEEVELLIRGSDQPLDVARLRNDALYDDCHDGDPEVVWFWDVFEEAGPKAQRKLLQFITGSDRLPIKGTMGIHITLVRGAAKIRLPQSRTCLDRLYLWQYGSKKLLRTKLWTAVYGSQGFGHH